MAYAMNSELVAILWLKGVTGLPADQVVTVLPRDNSSWAASGCVLVKGVIGGSPQMTTKVREPVLSIECVACNPDSEKAPWGKAFDLAGKILEGCEADNYQRGVTRSGYSPARVMGAEATEPKRVPGDAGAYARVTLDLTLRWIQLE